MKESKMNQNDIIKGFSKLNRSGRIKLLEDWLGENVSADLDNFLHSNTEIQSVFNEFSENFLSNYFLPLGIVPNVLINNEMFLVPVVIEESSVVAAASRASGFWAKNGGFRTEVFGTTKKGQVHFLWSGSSEFLDQNFARLKDQILVETHTITEGMRNRGGGITEIDLVDFTKELDNYYQIDVAFETADAMGANFINSCLEKIAEVLKAYFDDFSSVGELEVIMSILSNYTPESKVKCTVECEIPELAAICGPVAPHDFARRFQLAVQMANTSVSRAVTHNKGIYNGVDGVLIAAGNDWRAVEASGHAFAARNGRYESLSSVEISNTNFKYTITLPLAIGTVGGLTKNHPLAKLALKVLRNPSASKLMEITAAVGMANNFAALTSLITSGIQKGHMKMHLTNILNQLGASSLQKENAAIWFADKAISYSAVDRFLKHHTGDDSTSRGE